MRATNDTRLGHRLPTAPKSAAIWAEGVAPPRKQAARAFPGAGAAFALPSQSRGPSSPAKSGVKSGLIPKESKKINENNERRALQKPSFAAPTLAREAPGPTSPPLPAR